MPLLNALLTEILNPLRSPTEWMVIIAFLGTLDWRWLVAWLLSGLYTALLAGFGRVLLTQRTSRILLGSYLTSPRYRCYRSVPTERGKRIIEKAIETEFYTRSKVSYHSSNPFLLVYVEGTD